VQFLRRGEKKESGDEKKKKSRHTLLTMTCTTLPTKARRSASIAIVNKCVSQLKVAACVSVYYGKNINNIWQPNCTEYLVFIVFIIDYKSGIRDSKLGIITCI